MILVVVVALVGGLLSVFVLPAGAGPSWSFSSSPNPSGARDSWLNSVVCLNSHNCIAVGEYLSASSFQKTLVEHWNGSRWSIGASPNPPEAQSARLNAVSCTALGFCMAVGYSFGRGFKTLIERWNGSRWSIVPSRDPAGTALVSLNGVSCATSSDCWAVGIYTITYGHPLVEHWNGTSWSVVASPIPNPTQVSGLNAVSCTTGTACVAVGGTGNVPLVEQWNGRRWSTITSANPGGVPSIVPDTALYGVKCTSNNDCVAVGRRGTGKTLVEQWHGTTWSIVASPSLAGLNELQAVKCASSTDCIAVGDSLLQKTYPRRLIERWNGTNWSIIASAAPAGATNSLLQGLSCATRTDCIAVGGYMPKPGLAKTFVEQSA